MVEEGAHIQMNRDEPARPEAQASPRPSAAGPSAGPRPQASGYSRQRPAPTVLTWQDLTDLPRQILPEETYRHLQNACTEATLAAFSLWKSFNKARQGASKQPHRKRIEVE